MQHSRCAQVNPRNALNGWLSCWLLPSLLVRPVVWGVVGQRGQWMPWRICTAKIKSSASGAAIPQARRLALVLQQKSFITSSHHTLLPLSLRQNLSIYLGGCTGRFLSFGPALSLFLQQTQQPFDLFIESPVVLTQRDDLQGQQSRKQLICVSSIGNQSCKNTRISRTWVLLIYLRLCCIKVHLQNLLFLL